MTNPYSVSPMSLALVALLAISWLSSSAVTSYSLNKPPTSIAPSTRIACQSKGMSCSGSSRRQWMVATAGAALTAVTTTTNFGLPSQALAATTGATAKLATYNDPAHGFSISVPDDWTKTESELQDRRKIVVWSDPSDPKTALFIAYTPIRDDFTSLASFGTVDQVAAQTILPKGEMANTPGVQAEMISADSKKQAYIFDYYQSIANVQPPTHFRTIFSLAQGATGGAGAVLVTITLQTPEEKYKKSGGELKSTFDTIIDSYDKAKA